MKNFFISAEREKFKQGQRSSDVGTPAVHLWKYTEKSGMLLGVQEMLRLKNVSNLTSKLPHGLLTLVMLNMSIYYNPPQF